jgi:hypothetical protein
LYLLRACQSNPAVNPASDSADACRLRQRHSELLIAMMRDGITMRTITRHRLDDPRITDDVRAMLVEAARERQSKARFRRSEEQHKQERLRMLIQLSPFVRNAAAITPTTDSPEELPSAATKLVDPLSIQGTIQSIRRHVCAHFYLREMRDPELTARTPSPCLRPSAADRNVHR